MDNKNKNRFYTYQAMAFMDYISKFKVLDRDYVWFLFEHWASSKEFLKEDEERIQEIVERLWTKKEKQMAELEQKKNKSKNKTNEDDKMQLRFDFTDDCLGENKSDV